jgi:hypothetical protein
MKKLIFYTCLLLISVSANAQVPSYVPTDSLKGWWAFNGNANDASGNGNNGVVNGATLDVDRFGINNSAYNFNNNSIKINYSNSFTSQIGTISAWIFIDSLPTLNDAQDVIFGKGWGYPQLLLRNNGKIYLSIMSGQSTATVIESNSILVPGNWFHIVGFYSNNNFKLYINGVLDKSITPQPLPTYYSFCNSEYWIGGFNHQNSCIPNENVQNFSGKIDDIGFWNRGLTQQEITSLYTQNHVAQIPIYVPTNGLVGYWPFNGNANDASGNGNNGTVNGATLSTDRFGINSAAYSFNGTSNYIEVQHNSSQLLSNKVSFSLWIFPLDYSTFNNQTRAPLGKRRTSTTSGIGFETVDGVGSCCGPQFYLNNNTSSGGLDYESSISLPNNSWTHLVGTYDGVVLKLYQNSVLLGTASGTINLSTTIQNLFFGREGSNTPQNYFKGIIDDIGFWNRALTQQEVTNLYNGNICFETVRVTDTLVINVNRTGYNPITYSNTIKVYPNPANNKITIDNGDIQKMNGYSIKIINSLGQQVYQGAITQQIVSIDITQWAGNGMYYLQLTDNNGNIVDVKKIVLQ